MKPCLFFIGSCVCLLAASLVFKSGSAQGALIFGMIALLSIGVLVKVLRS